MKIGLLAKRDGVGRGPAVNDGERANKKSGGVFHGD
jgi:hypothetical protein